MLEAATSSSPVSVLCIDADPSELLAARDYAAQAAVAFGLDAEECYDFVYAANEAVTNAIRHGAPDTQGQIHLSISEDAERLVFAVRDFGTFAPPTTAVDGLRESGRGLDLMRLLTDEVRLCVEPGCTTVHLSKARASHRPSARR